MKYNVEMAYGFCASLVVEADSKEEAIEIAKAKVDDDPKAYADDIQFEDLNYVSDPSE